MMALCLNFLLTETQALCAQGKGVCGREQRDEQQPRCPASIPNCLSSHQERLLAVLDSFWCSGGVQCLTGYISSCGKGWLENPKIFEVVSMVVVVC